MTIPTSTPARARRASRMCLAERSESTGRSAAQPASTFERSMPAFAHTKPCAVSLMMRSPRRRTMRTDSDSTSARRASRSSGSRGTSRFSAFDTIFCVTTTQSRSTSGVPCAAAASATWTAISSPGRISPIPAIGMTESVTPLPRASVPRGRPRSRGSASSCRPRPLARPPLRRRARAAASTASITSDEQNGRVLARHADARDVDAERPHQPVGRSLDRRARRRSG